MEKTTWNGLRIILLAVLVGLAALLVWLFVRYLVPFRVLNLDPAEVTRVTIRYDTPGSEPMAVLEDRAEIEALASQLHEVRVCRVLFDGQRHWGCGMGGWELEFFGSGGKSVTVLLDPDGNVGRDDEQFRIMYGESLGAAEHVADLTYDE